MGCLYYFIRLCFFLAQAVSWYIIITYTTVILPYSEPTSDKTLNTCLIAVNYVIHLVFISLHHYSHWMTFLSDPGYVSTFYKSVKIGWVFSPSQPPSEAMLAAQRMLPDNEYV